MYSVIQIPQILDGEFRKYVQYQEIIREGLNPEICIWFMHKDNNNTIYNTILPDGCVDIIFNLDSKEVFLTGTKKATIRMKNSSIFNYMGIRLRPGVANYIFKNIETSMIFKKHYPIPIDTPGYDLLQQVFLITHIVAKISLIYEFLDGFKKSVDDEWVQLINKTYESNDVNQTFKTIKDEYGLDSKYFYRMCIEKYGIPPKEMINTIRLQKSLSKLTQNKFETLTN